MYYSKNRECGYETNSQWILWEGLSNPSPFFRGEAGDARLWAGAEVANSCLFWLKNVVIKNKQPISEKTL